MHLPSPVKAFRHSTHGTPWSFELKNRMASFFGNRITYVMTLIFNVILGYYFLIRSPNSCFLFKLSRIFSVFLINVTLTIFPRHWGRNYVFSFPSHPLATKTMKLPTVK